MEDKRFFVDGTSAALLLIPIAIVLWFVFCQSLFSIG
jgi:hypothetical protein